MKMNNDHPMCAILNTYNYNVLRLANVCEISWTTARHRMEDPDTFTIREIRCLHKAGIPLDLLRKAVG